MKRVEFYYENLDKHGVSAQEVTECLQRGKVKYLRKVGERKYRLIAQTASGRYLEVIYRDFPDERFIFHAMDARRRDIRLLRRKGKRQ
jgi:hypothetical protein